MLKEKQEVKEVNIPMIRKETHYSDGTVSNVDLLADDGEHTLMFFKDYRGDTQEVMLENSEAKKLAEMMDIKIHFPIDGTMPEMSADEADDSTDWECKPFHFPNTSVKPESFIKAVSSTLDTPSKKEWKILYKGENASDKWLKKHGKKLIKLKRKFGFE